MSYYLIRVFHRIYRNEIFIPKLHVLNLQYFSQLPISFAIDYTFEFGWIKDGLGNVTTEESLYSNDTATLYNITSGN